MVKAIELLIANTEKLKHRISVLEAAFDNPQSSEQLRISKLPELEVVNWGGSTGVRLVKKDFPVGTKVRILKVLLH